MKHLFSEKMRDNELLPGESKCIEKEVWEIGEEEKTFSFLAIEDR